MHILRKFIVASSILHLILIVLVCWFGSGSHALKRRYVVFGAHSTRPKQVTYKSSHLFNRNQIGKRVGGKAGVRGNATGRVQGKGRVKQAQKKVPQKTRAKTNSRRQAVPVAKIKPIAQKKGPTIKDLAKKKMAEKKIAQQKLEQKRIAQKKLVQKKLEQERLAREHIEREAKKEREIKAKRAQEKKRQLAQKEALARKKLEQELEEQQQQEEIEPSSREQGPLSVMNDEGDGPIEVPVYAEAVEEAEFNVNTAVYQKNIQQEVERLWHPPVGVAKGTTCTLLIDINAQGKVSKAELITRSQVLIYDLSVIKIAKKFAFNESLWGKQFKIDFRQ